MNEISISGGDTISTGEEESKAGMSQPRSAVATSGDHERHGEGKEAPAASSRLLMSTKTIDHSVQVPDFTESGATSRELVDALFAMWDVSNTGVIDIEDIMSSNIGDEAFSKAIYRTLNEDGYGDISKTNLQKVVKILKGDDMQSRVSLFLRFMDENGDGTISAEEAEVYMVSGGSHVLEKLGLNASDLTYTKILELFEDDGNGVEAREEAIAIFCDHILGVLEGSISSNLKSKNSSIGAYVSATFSSLGGSGNSFCKTIRKTIRGTSKLTYFKIFIVCLQIALFVLNFKKYKAKGKNDAFATAKGFGLCLRIDSMLMFLSMARTTMGFIYTFEYLRWAVPMGFNIEIHSFLGLCVMISMFGHTFGHLAAHDGSWKEGFHEYFSRDSIIRTGEFNEEIAKGGDGITGLFLLIMGIAMGLTSAFRGGSSSNYARFYYTHFFYLLWLWVLLLHVPWLWPYFAAIGSLMVLERSYDLLNKTVLSTLSHSRPCGRGVTFVSVKRNTTTSIPGSYYRIKVPEISMIEWHPFSLGSSCASNNITFFVASVGDWSKKLYELVQEKDGAKKRSDLKVLVQGPFLAPAYTAPQRSDQMVMCVASGIGITPFFSVMATKVTEEQVSESDRDIFAGVFQETLSGSNVSLSTPQMVVQSIRRLGRLSKSISMQDLDRAVPMRVIWSIRDPSELLFYLDYVHELMKKQSNLKEPVVFVDIYLTGLGKRADWKFTVTQTLFLLAVSHKTGDFMKIHFGRPNMERIVQESKPDAVYYCGGKVLADVLSETCMQHDIPFHPEDFDSGASLLPNALKWVKKKTCSTCSGKAKSAKPASAKPEGLKAQKSSASSPSKEGYGLVVEGDCENMGGPEKEHDEPPKGEDAEVAALEVAASEAAAEQV